MASRVSSPTAFFWMILLGCSLLSSEVMAAAAAKRMQQQKALQEQMIQQQYQEQLAQKQAQEVAVYQQAVAERQAQMQQIAAQQKAAAEYAAAKQAMQQAVAQKQAQAVAEYQQQAAYAQVQNVLSYKQSQAVQQAASAKTQAQLNGEIQEYAQYMATRQAAMAKQAVAMQQAQTDMEMAQYYERQKIVAAQNRIALQARVQQEDLRRRKIRQAAEQRDTQAESSEGQEESGPAAVVSIEELWQALDRDSNAWSKIMDADIKRLTVAEYMDRFRKLGIRISKSPGEYVGIIDAMSGQNSGLLNAPFLNVLSYAAIVEYDFDNGQDKDELARRALGEANFQANKKRVLKK